MRSSSTSSWTASWSSPSRPAGGLPEDSEPIILAAVAAQALAAVSPRYPNGEFTLEVVDGGAVVEAPAAWVASAIKNLVTNAAKYGGAEPVVTVRIQREDERAVLRVLDRGAGFSQPEADRLFEPFFRTASARQQAQGTGLGLALVERVVRRLDGTVWARPRQGGGAEVGFALPICGDDDGTDAPSRPRRFWERNGHEPFRSAGARRVSPASAPGSRPSRGS